jgi:HD superfamily phosphohydrolase
MDELKKKYFEILEPDFPEWLNEYINTEQVQRLKYVSMACGKKYTKLFDLKYDFSTLDHSISVALIIWHFTKDRKQTLSGLFHDISTPVFKHCIDFMNGDSETQESTEEKTSDIIRNSSKIMSLLK